MEEELSNSKEANTETTLIIASKLKQYIKGKSGLNTSASVLHCLSDIVRKHCDSAIEHAKENGRKTVMDRDFSK